MKQRPKRSPVWKVSKDELQRLVSESETIGQVLAYFGLKNHGSNFQTLRRRFKADGIDYTKFKGNFGCGLLRPLVSLEAILVVGSDYNRSSLKQRLLKTGLLKNECAICGQQPVWYNKPLMMVLDHINGVNNDNRLVNLRLICPNCNSQTDTFAGRNKRRIGE